MFGLLKKKPSQATNSSVVLAITGMHCTSCALNIDLTLEDVAGVSSARTSYAHQTVSIAFDKSKVTIEQLQSAIAELGYQTTLPNP